jgi:hypothetical protein
VGHQRPDLLWVFGHQRQCVHRTTTAGEQVHWAAIDGFDHPAQIGGMNVRVDRADRIVLLAPLAPARVIGDDGAIGEMACQSAEACGPIGEPIRNNAGSSLSSFRRTS